jgi:hypothetical protein
MCAAKLLTRNLVCCNKDTGFPQELVLHSHHNKVRRTLEVLNAESGCPQKNSLGIVQVSRWVNHMMAADNIPA